jgi:hypothetical protein
MIACLRSVTNSFKPLQRKFSEMDISIYLKMKLAGGNIPPAMPYDREERVELKTLFRASCEQ